LALWRLSKPNPDSFTVEPEVRHSEVVDNPGRTEVAPSPRVTVPKPVVSKGTLDPQGDSI
jgi:hypothetical protein